MIPSRDAATPAAPQPPPARAEAFRFGEFRLDVAERQLWRGGAAVDLTGRYFDALVLLVREAGQLVGKDRLFAEVWGDVVVGDAALTQCVKDVRRALGDDAARPRFIQTVPRYGYRFIAPVESGARAVPELIASEPVAASAAESAAAVRPVDSAAAHRAAARPAALRGAALGAGAGLLGGAAAGVLGGLFYGLALASAPSGASLGTASVLLVLVSLCVAVGGLGGLGVGAGLAVAGLAGLRPAGRVAGAAFGGMLVGGAAKLLGVDAFTLLFGRAPAGITGGVEGAVLGAALAAGLLAGGGPGPGARPVASAAVACAAAGLLIPLAGGRLMGGSLDLLARAFAGSRLETAALGRFFGEAGLGATTQAALGGIEGLLFGGCVAAALGLVRRLRT